MHRLDLSEKTRHVMTTGYLASVRKQFEYYKSLGEKPPADTQ